MGATMASEKLNSGYIMRPLSWFKKGYTHTHMKLRAFLYAFAREGNACAIGYAKLTEKLNTSRTSIWRGISKEKDGTDFVIEREGGKVSRYTYVGESEKEFNVRTELFFYTEKFAIGSLDRYLTDAEVDVLSLIYTWTRYEKVGRYEGNYNDIARQLGLDYYTVYRAVGVLKGARLIKRLKKATNNNDKSVYMANMKRLKALDKLNAKKEKKASETKGSKELRDLNAKIDMKRSDELMQETARNKAEDARKRANAVPRFRELAAELGRLGREQAKAELYAPLTLPALEAEAKELSAERADILRELGIQEWELDKDEQYKRLIELRRRPKGGGGS